MKNFSLFLCIFLLCLWGGSACAGNDQCAVLINTRCQACHYKSRICQTLGQKSKGEWQNTVKNMIRHGAKLSDAEKATVANCLFNAPAGADFVCKN